MARVARDRIPHPTHGIRVADQPWQRCVARVGDSQHLALGRAFCVTVFDPSLLRSNSDPIASLDCYRILGGEYICARWAGGYAPELMKIVGQNDLRLAFGLFTAVSGGFIVETKTG